VERFLSSPQLSQTQQQQQQPISSAVETPYPIIATDPTAFVASISTQASESETATYIIITT
jgi:hypothetical protein